MYMFKDNIKRFLELIEDKKFVYPDAEYVMNYTHYQTILGGSSAIIYLMKSVLI